jgi:hypothetical protein
MNELLKILSLLLGALVVAGTLFSALESFVLPRGVQDPLTRFVFRLVRFLFNFLLSWSHSYPDRDRVMAFYAPVALLLILPAWYVLILLGYMLMFWGTGLGWFEAFRESGSSLFTLGFAQVDGLSRSILAFSEGMFGLMLVALLIAYLPTIYAAFSRREAAVTLLEVRAGNPPTAVEMIRRYYRIHGFNRLTDVWASWETWFADIEESHTSLPALVFFRSPQPEHSWITAAGAILDTASLVESTVDTPDDPQAALCIRAGYLALRRIADVFSIPYDPAPRRGAPTSISRAEFDLVVSDLRSTGVPIKPDLDLAYLDFCGWRVNYDQPLLALANLTMAPASPWTGKRDPKYSLPYIWGKKKHRPLSQP